MAVVMGGEGWNRLEESSRGNIADQGAQGQRELSSNTFSVHGLLNTKCISNPLRMIPMEDRQHAAARLTRRAIIAYAIVEAVLIFGAIAITLRRRSTPRPTVTPAPSHPE